MGMLVFPDYTQDNDLWLQLQDYQHEDWQTLVRLLQYYNRHICHLIRAIADRIVYVDNGVITDYPGDYDYFLYKSGQVDAQGKPIASPEEVSRVETARIRLGRMERHFFMYRWLMFMYVR